MKKGINVYLDAELEGKVASAAKEQGISMSAWFRLLAVKELGASTATKVEACPKCGTTVNDLDEAEQQQFYVFPNGIWRCTNCGGDGKWKDA